MKELEVVVDVHQSSESPDLIVVKRKVAAEGGDLILSGEPVESRISLASRRVRGSVELSSSVELGPALVAHIQNISFAPLSITEVVFEYLFQGPPLTQSGKILAEQYGPRRALIPGERTSRVPLQPGESRDWFLVKDFFEDAVMVGRSLPVEQYAILVFAGKEEVGRIGGKAIKPLLEMAATRERWVVNSRAKAALEALPRDEQEGVRGAMGAYASASPDHWGNGEVIRLPDDREAYLVRVSPTLRAFIRRHDDGQLELFDLMAEDTLRFFLQSLEKAEAQG